MATLKKQFLRFAAVGTLNTLIDFSILNALAFAFQSTSGIPLVLCNSAAFLAASLNSYFLNKKWTFDETTRTSFRQYLFFMLFALSGLIINDTVVYILTTTVARPAEINPFVWTNIAKAAATGVTMFWNFACFRNLVFRDKRRYGGPDQPR